MSTYDSHSVLITGGSGFIGRAFAEAGRLRSARMQFIQRRPYHVPDVIVENADLTQLTVSQWREILGRLRPDTIVHLAAAGVSYGSSDIAELIRTNVTPFAMMLEAASAMVNPPRVVAIGSGFEYQPIDRPRKETDPCLPNSLYGASKLSATAIAAAFASRLSITILRPFSLYGPFEPEGRLAPYLILSAFRGESIELTPGEQIRDYTEVSDVAEVIWRVVESPAASGVLRVLNVGSGLCVSLRSYVETIARCLSSYGFVPDIRFGARPYRKDEMMNYSADVSMLRSVIGWIPDTPLETGINRQIKHFLERDPRGNTTAD